MKLYHTPTNNEINTQSKRGSCLFSFAAIHSSITRIMDRCQANRFNMKKESQC